MNLIKKIQENIFRHELFGRGAKIVVGVSGGPDSVCLLDVLSRLKQKYDLEIVIAHVNYGLRGQDSEKDEKLAGDLAKKYSFDLEIKKIPDTEYQILNTISEEKLRKIRYDFFEKVRKKYLPTGQAGKATAIAVGHNLNDQAETVLMRIIRGAGLRGLGAIKFKNNNIIRPLLNIPRKEILAHLRKNKIRYRIDQTNLGTDFTRNKIRNLLIPYLEKNFNPNIQELLYKFSESVAADYDFISRYAGVWLAANKTPKVFALNNLHPSILREVLRQALEKHNSNLREIESVHIEEIIKIIKSSKNKRQKITFKGLKIERRGDRLLITAA